ncbi:MAG: ABC transporter ATP-binding protein [Candidatus Eisenbacteria bacterium]|nr:ABC transporter ATP-binding protein [Candidatus Eisenbacteria bacterium]
MDPVYYEEETTVRTPTRILARRMLGLLKGHGVELAVCLVLLFAASSVSLVGPILVKRAIDVDIAERNFRGLVLTVLLFVAAQLAFLLLSYVQRVRLETVGQAIISSLRERLFARVTGMSLSFFDKNPVGRLISRVESDTEAMRMLFTSAVVTFLGDIIMFLGMLAVMAYVNLKLTLVTSLVLPPILTAAWIFSKKTTPLFLTVRKRMADITAFLTEHLQGSAIVQIFGREKQTTEAMRDANQRKYETALKVELIVVAFFNTLFLTETIGVTLILWQGGKWALSGAVTIGTLMMFMGYVRRFFEPLHRLSEELSTFQRAFSGAQRVFELLDTQPEITDKPVTREWKRFEKGIDFENVWFSYDNHDWVLRDITFSLSKGQRWALVGATGGGKTSIISLLLRFYQPQRGRILVDGIDIKELSQEELRAKIGLVLQDIFLFPGNVLENLRMGEKTLSPDRVMEAARRIRVDDVVNRLPRGLETELAERGDNLSTGERQLLSFLRALLVDPDILVLDEATSSVDPHTERLLRRAMKELMAGRTSLVIAHRLSTVMDSDHILVIHDGEVVERGNHSALMAQKGYYRKLFRLQCLATRERETPAAGGDE